MVVTEGRGSEKPRSGQPTAGEEHRGRGGVAGAGEPPVLALSDLIADRSGEVVLYNDSNMPVLTLLTSERPVARGTVEAHVTASGIDVAGYDYVTFANGLTLYYPQGLQLVILSEAG